MPALKHAEREVLYKSSSNFRWQMRIRPKIFLDAYQDCENENLGQQIGSAECSADCCQNLA